MNIKQKITTVIVSLFVAIGVGTLVLPPSPVLADCTPKGEVKCCGDAKVTILPCNAKGGTDAKDSAIWQTLLLILNILTGGVGIAAVGGIVYGSILYTSAADNAAQTKKAIEIITNVVIGVVAYGVMYLVLNYIIPGGIFG